MIENIQVYRTETTTDVYSPIVKWDGYAWNITYIPMVISICFWTEGTK